MATTDFVYGKARIALGSGAINLLTASVKAMLVGNAYSPAPIGDQYVSSIPSPAIVARSPLLTGNGITSSGVFFGNIPVFGALLSATPVVAMILYIDTGSDASSPLLYYTSGGVGFPFTPQGLNYFIGFDQVNGGYFQA